MKSFSRVRLLATPWTAAHQAPLSMGFARQEYWSGVPLPSPSKVPRGVKFIETETRIMVARGWGRRSRELVFDGVITSVLPDENVLEMDCGAGCTTI